MAASYRFFALPNSSCQTEAVVLCCVVLPLQYVGSTASTTGTDAAGSSGWAGLDNKGFVITPYAAACVCLPAATALRNKAQSHHELLQLRVGKWNCIASGE
jgi:hypothetical protein